MTKFHFFHSIFISRAHLSGHVEADISILSQLGLYADRQRREGNQAMGRSFSLLSWTQGRFKFPRSYQSNENGQNTCLQLCGRSTSRRQYLCSRHFRPYLVGIIFAVTPRMEYTITSVEVSVVLENLQQTISENCVPNEGILFGAVRP